MSFHSQPTTMFVWKSRTPSKLSLRPWNLPLGGESISPCWGRVEGLNAWMPHQLVLLRALGATAG